MKRRASSLSGEDEFEGTSLGAAKRFGVGAGSTAGGRVRFIAGSRARVTAACRSRLGVVLGHRDHSLVFAVDRPGGICGCGRRGGVDARDGGGSK